MYANALFCEECGWRGPLGLLYSCPDCGYSLSVDYDYEKIVQDEVKNAFFAAKSLWDFELLLPVKDPKNCVSLCEGGTPLLDSRKIGKKLGINLYFKDETRNPTCAFKDRPNTAGISTAIELGACAVAIASTGNGAASLAAYAARAGIECHVFVPEDTSHEKVRQAKAHGAHITGVKGSYSNAFHAANEACIKNNWANCTSTYLNPYTLEGDKTIAYELYVQMEANVPDWIIVPLGAGAMLSGIYKGFSELKALGLVDRLPKMAGVQAKNCSPIITAFERGGEEVTAADAANVTDTTAHAIADPLAGYERDGTRTLRCIRRSNGCGVSIDEDMIKNYTEILAREEGMYVETSSSTAVAAAEVMKLKGFLQEGETVVSIITGHGLKDGSSID